ncbi:hypothetical protein D5086_000500 [Populus alba]|uniref:Uncharacterized protein n=1 Tax=Populus alba TaxID=43335 RepID=A0ACC4CXJ4_POPAL
MMFLVMQSSAFQSGTNPSDSFLGVAGRDIWVNKMRKLWESNLCQMKTTTACIPCLSSGISACWHLLCEAENQEASGKIEESDMFLLCNFNLRSYTNIRSQPRKMCDKWIMLGDIAGVGA